METPGDSSSQKDPVAAAVDLVLARGGREIRIAAPLGLGKPNILLNAIYSHFKGDSSRNLTIATALSLQIPKGKVALERRFLEPFTKRHFGEHYPELDYATDLRDGKLPPNVKVQEFYFASGAMLGSERAQRDYVSINYTHVARDLLERGELHAIVQLIAERGERCSLSCNPDVTLDLLDRIEMLGMKRPLVIGVVHPELPFLGGDAEVDANFFDVLLATTDAEQPLFALPREPIDFAEHAIGLHASTLVKDGGTLQIGIGALSDALVSALVLRHEKNADYLSALGALREKNIAEDSLVARYGGLSPFVDGLYGASEMVMDGFMHLRRTGILKRVVHDDFDEKTARGSRAHFLKGAFFLGSKDLYAWLRNLSDEDFDGIFMSRVSDVNQLYGGREQLDAAQRKDARFFNICMMATALGAAVSDALEDGRVVSGVGGQYNFVAMAHAIEGGRSVLLLRSTRANGDRVDSNIKWNYGHTTIPRHLRDIFVTEYGVADLRGKSDEECVTSMLAVTDARFQEEIVRAAVRGKKLPHDFRIPDAFKSNTPEALADKMRPLKARGLFVRFPFGSDFTPIEQRLLPALSWLAKQQKSEDWGALAGAIALPGKSADADACLERLGLVGSLSVKDRMLARLVRGALARTAEDQI